MIARANIEPGISPAMVAGLAEKIVNGDFLLPFSQTFAIASQATISTKQGCANSSIDTSTTARKQKSGTTEAPAAILVAPFAGDAHTLATNLQGTLIPVAVDTGGMVQVATHAPELEVDFNSNLSSDSAVSLKGEQTEDANSSITPG